MSSSDTDPTELEHQHQREADKLEEQSKGLGQDIDDVSQDWQQKRADQSVPGAKTPDDLDGDSDEEEPDHDSDDEESDEDSDDDEG